MTMREEFEAWAELYLPNDESPRKIALAAWQAAYRAGQEAMRERAAQLLEVEYAGTAEQQRRLHQIAGHIRALDAD